MTLLTAGLAAALLNLTLAANVYLSLRGWLVPLEPSGMQLMIHLVITAPGVTAISIWFFMLGRDGKCSPAFWKINALGLLIPIISLQKGVSHYGYDKLGLLVTCFIAAALIFLYVRHVWHYARS